MIEITIEFKEKILRKFTSTITEDALGIENTRKEARWKELAQMDFEKMTDDEYNEYYVIMMHTDKKIIRKWMDALEEI
ncbi:MAG: hypothetical protein WC623_22450 [Pedobacter sp.]|uniref:hypothetical protein n=1 Tax=Pedobacter sp. TaxID=1411316 RepID=UPI003566E94A